MGEINIKLLKNSITAFLFISLPFYLCQTVYALTESDVQAAVSSHGKEAVSGNVFIWFLCAVAFLKISQKIDSFMSGLGVNVGRAGGSMMAEALIAARGLGIGGKTLFNKGGSGSQYNSGSSGGGFLSGGLAGVVGRKINDSAISAATGKDGGILGKAAFESSLKNNGGYAKDIISKIATGDIAKTGSIAGETADKALSSYLGYDSGISSADSISIPEDTIGIDETIGSMTASEMSALSGIDSEISPIESIPGTIENVNSSEAHTETVSADDSEFAVHTGDSTAPTIGSHPDMPCDINESSSEMNVTGGELIASDIQSADEAHIPLTDVDNNMPELPEITPYYADAATGAEPVSQIPDGQDNIPAYSPSGESIGITGHETIAAEISDKTDHARNTNTVMPAQDISGATVQAFSQEIQNAASVDAVPIGSSVSVSNNQIQSNMAVSTAAVSVNTNTGISSDSDVTQQEHISNSVSTPIDSLAEAPITESDKNIGGIPQLEASAVTQGFDTGGIPSFSNVEIGGGRITGMETSDKFPGGIEFGMYDAAQYVKPQGDFSIVKTVDGVKWYKQYAAPSVEKTPIVGEGGKIKYEEKIVNRIPPVPRRKDRV